MDYDNTLFGGALRMESFMKMRMRFLFIASLIPTMALGNSGCGHNVRFIVTDEQGRPIEDATVSISYQTGFIPGEGFGRDINKTIRKNTSSAGIVTFRISPFGNKNFGYGVRDDKGRYYRDIGMREVWYEEEEGITERKVTLRAKQNPTALFSPEYYNLSFPQKNGRVVMFDEAVGFDVVIGDWIAPYGKGKIADILFRSYNEESGTPYVRNSFGVLELGKDFRYAAAFSLTFANEDDGIVEAIRYWPTSTLSVEREAPSDGYQKEIRMEWHRPRLSTDFDGNEKRQYFFRVRTQRNRDGKVVYALYGRLTGEPSFGGGRSFERCQDFNYVLNLTPMDRNLEYSGENLKENMTLCAHVNADYIRRFPSVLLNQDNYLRSLPTLAEEERKKASTRAEP